MYSLTESSDMLLSNNNLHSPQPKLIGHATGTVALDSQHICQHSRLSFKKWRELTVTILSLRNQWKLRRSMKVKFWKITSVFTHFVQKTMSGIINLTPEKSFCYVWWKNYLWLVINSYVWWKIFLWLVINFYVWGKTYLWLVINYFSLRRGKTVSDVRIYD